MTPSSLQRVGWLAAITLIVAVAALALARRDAGGGHTIPGAVPVPGTVNGYYTARAAPYGPTANHPRTACGEPFTSSTQGISHPVLPCGVKIYLEFRGREVLTQVVDHGHTAPGRVFDVTLPVAKLLRLQGSQTIRWRFAS